MKLKHIAVLLLSIASCKGAGGLVTGPLSPTPGGGGGGTNGNQTPWIENINAAGFDLSAVGEVSFASSSLHSFILNTGGGNIILSNIATGAHLTIQSNGLVDVLSPTSSTNLAATLVKTSTGYRTNWYANTDAQRATALRTAFSNGSDNDIVIAYPGVYQLSNTLHFAKGMQFIGAGQDSTYIVYYESNTTPSYCLDLRTNCVVRNMTITNWYFDGPYYQNILGYDYENSINQRFENVNIYDFTGYSASDWFIMKDLYTDDPTPPFYTRIDFWRSRLLSRWDHQTTGNGGGGLDWAPIFDLRYHNTFIGFAGTNGTAINFTGNDGNQRIWRGIDSYVPDGGSVTYAGGQFITLENSIVQVVNTNLFAIFGSTTSFVSNYSSSFFFSQKRADTTAITVFKSYSSGLFWTNGVQQTPVIQIQTQ